ncbi:MAG: AMP-binding protein [Sneathiella sp.]|uniref:AMP-binding protein n=1 Tax=Sneathiella sp. TaxID=1964365 RepID=UPI003002E5C6
MKQKEKERAEHASLQSTPKDSFEIFRDRIDQVLMAGGTQTFADLPEGTITYAELMEEMSHLDKTFQKLGLFQGSRAVIFSKNDRTVIVLFLSLLRSGFTPVIGDKDAKFDEIQDCLEVCQPTLIFSDTQLLSADLNFESINARHMFEIDDAGGVIASNFGAVFSESIELSYNNKTQPIANSPDVAMLVFTSGTTSKPKAVELTYANLIAQLEIFSEAYGFGAGIKLLNLLPFHHVDGLIRGPLCAIWFGGSVHRPIPFSVQNTPKILASVEEQKITHFISVPAMLRIIERVGRTDTDVFQTLNFKFILSSADVLTEQLWRRLEQTFNVPVANAYGLSEVVCDAVFAGPDEKTRQIGTLGRPVGCKLEILDDEGLPVPRGEPGELVISGPTVMKGYFNDSALTVQVIKNGKFHTGDYVRQAESGFYQFVGRKKNAIVTAGVTIHPEAVTSVLANMPGIEEAVVFGVPDANRNQRLVAALVPEQGKNITTVEAAAYCRRHLSAERTPSEFRILEALPRTAAGKVQMKTLSSIESGISTVIPEKDVLSIAAFCFDIAREGLSADSTPFNTEGWDSLAHMTLIEEIELQFEIMFSARQIAQIASLGDAIKFVAEATD